MCAITKTKTVSESLPLSEVDYRPPVFIFDLVFCCLKYVKLAFTDFFEFMIEDWESNENKSKNEKNRALEFRSECCKFCKIVFVSILACTVNDFYSYEINTKITSKNLKLPII